MSSASDRAEEKPAAPGWMVQHPMVRAETSQERCCVRQWKDVSGVKCPELQVVLLEGREKDGAPIQTVLPLPVHRSLSHKSIRLALDRGAPVLLCAVASDSTLVYQRMTDGLVTPDPPVGPIQDLGRRQHRKRRQQH
ncbi:tRNA-splicing endonuclease subunit Sen15 isoform X2 [Myripristis murdjan]|uniref:tRNA-splicing endonuclease subunit Sen15 isoform X2 n=1 Tax=Myripristis murdjan TaxID=586833 RepID=UPI001175E832|nr:tRNA-splicing endonuclease subunit Sen15 isoform X2 [Myripristis murdjan]